MTTYDKFSQGLAAKIQKLHFPNVPWLGYGHVRQMRFRERRVSWRFVEQAILVQEQWFEEAEETKEGFTQMIRELPLRRQSKNMSGQGLIDTETQ
jgi:hypothetical protein